MGKEKISKKFGVNDLVILAGAAVNLAVIITILAYYFLWRQG